ncbi:MAG: MotA/TolQ/ExbB proton channel family protein [Opitutaceae bacterium]
MTQLESEILGKRHELRAAQRERENAQTGAERLRVEVKAREDENAYMRNLMAEYIRNFDTRVHPSEVQLYREQAFEALNVSENPNMAAAQKFEQQIAVIRTALDRIEKVIGGERFEGAALDAGGVVKEGRFSLVGPIAMFSSADGAIHGVAQGQVNAQLPAVVSIHDGRFDEDIATLTATGAGFLPVDASLGNALRLELTRDSFIEHLRKGGPVMIPILLLALATIAVAVFKFFDITSVKPAPSGTVRQLVEHVNKGENARALGLAASIPGPFGDVLAAGVKHAHEDRELLDEVLYERLLAAQPRLERLLAFISLAAGAAPLLGLLGTVTGMIQTFKLITVFGTGDAGKLADGISEALITTEYGLIVAIPALLVHAVLLRLARRRLSRLEQAALAFANGVSARPR